MRRRKVGISFLLAGLVFLLTACGGDTGFVPEDPAKSSPGVTPPPPPQGVFIDSAVEGMRYKSGDLSGKTNEAGEFSYDSNLPVTFYVGDIEIGQSRGASLLSPINLVPGAVNEAHPTVTNIARFLQTIDDDANPDNGITITAVVYDLALEKTINFQQSVTDFAEDGAVQVLIAEMTAATSEGARPLVNALDAQAHLNASLAKHADDE